MNHWLMKTEPSTYSFEQLLKDGKTNWSGVRNFQARNNLRACAKGDLVLIYHSGDEKAVVGIAKITSAPYPDPDPKKAGEWLQLDLAPVKRLSRPVPLKEIKATRELHTLALVKHSRLSVMPVSPAHYTTLLKVSGGN